jgi:hypothetical protein
MSALPVGQWRGALDQMDSALQVAVRTLDRAEERWDRALAPSAGEGEVPPALDRLDARLRAWEARLRAAEQLTGSVSTELTDRAAAVERWHALFAQWLKVLQQAREGLGKPPQVPPDELHHVSE